MIGSPNDLSGGQVIPIIKPGMTKWVRFRAVCSIYLGPDSDARSELRSCYPEESRHQVGTMPHFFLRLHSNELV